MNDKKSVSVDNPPIKRNLLNEVAETISKSLQNITIEEVDGNIIIKPL